MQQLYTKKIRKFLSSDLDQQILGIILDKFLGLIYGLVFSYIIFATLLYGIEKINYFESFCVLRKTTVKKRSKSIMFGRVKILIYILIT